MNWEKQHIEAAEVRSFSERFGVDLLTAAIFVRRGVVDAPRVRYYLEDDIRLAHNPFCFEGMTDAVERILTARAEGEKVMVFGDRDVDGITSIALLVEALAELEVDVTWRLPLGDDPYGITVEAVDEFAAADGTLIITVDCGNSSNVEIAHALERGIDTIVLDHHNPQGEQPPATVIINPKNDDSHYPFTGLCACAVASKLKLALLMATTDFYNQPVCLLNVRPGNETLIIEAVKLENLVETDRLIENVVPGVVDLDRTRIVPFLEGQQILVYDAAAQTAMVRRIFGPGVEISFLDIAPEVWKVFPALAGKGLLSMRAGSKQARYANRIPEEIDILVSLFQSFAYKRTAPVLDRYDSCLDLVALGTLADMMPLENENRILVKNGLRILNSTGRVGLRELLSRLGLRGKDVISKDIAWVLGPVLNASGRMGEPDKAVRLLLSKDPAEASRLVEEVVALNEERKRTGDEAWGRILPRAYESLAAHDNRFVVVTDEAVHRGITGIIAGKLSKLLNVPAAVVAILPEKAVGSIRSARGFGVTEFLSKFGDIFLDWGGHDSAGGFHMRVDRYDEFAARVLELVPQIYLAEGEGEVTSIDAELPHDFLTPALFDIQQVFAPFGQDSPPLTFLVRNIRIAQMDLIGREEQKHVKFLLDAGAYKWPALFWNAAERVGRDFVRTDRLDVVFQISKNYFQNREIPQLIVTDVRRAGGAGSTSKAEPEATGRVEDPAVPAESGRQKEPPASDRVVP